MSNKYVNLVEETNNSKTVGITFHKGGKTSYVKLQHKHKKDTYPEKLINDFLKSYTGSDVSYDFVMATYNKGHVISCTNEDKPVMEGDSFYVVDIDKKKIEKE